MKRFEKKVLVPLDVPKQSRKTYLQNYLRITKGSGRLMLFAGDQRIEHLNDDFTGKGVSKDDADPEHFFRIASRAKIGAFATQLGMISKYAMDYKNINYIVKINSKTNIVKTKQRDPYSEMLYDVEQVAEFQKQTGIKICGVGYTLYLGSEYEAQMLRDAAQIINKAHQNGMVVILWVYPRGAAVKDEKDSHLIAGAVGVANALGADFAKVSYPEKKGKSSKQSLKEIITAAGRTKVIFAGGGSTGVKNFLKTLNDQLEAGASGNATGRNVHQKDLDDAVRMCNAIYALTVEHKNVDFSYDEYLQKNKFS